MPRLFTRMSMSGSSRSSAAVPSSVATSAATPITSPCKLATASSTRDGVRPFTATRAPALANPSAIASPMPWVEPVTSAVFPVRSMFTPQYYHRETSGIPVRLLHLCLLVVSADLRLLVVSADLRLLVVSADGHVAELALQNLPGRVARQFVEEDHLARHLVARQVIAHIRLDGVLVHTGALGLDHEGAQPVTPLFVLDTERGRLDDL